ncbi:hypothetical protein QUB08_22350 [Microcoleus sp. BR0-C5]|uniref:hypothetical protein n=1 Tax=Microcoleus sp. BR0-C5 TaxID=2818713 RepID=UPI002FD67C05
MESKSISISLDEPLLTQAAVKEMLNLSSEAPLSKVKASDLLEVAKSAIRNQLVSCQCSENELIGLRLEYQVSKEATQKLREIYLVSVEWKAYSQNKNVAEPTEKFSEEHDLVKYIDRLHSRVEEAVTAIEGHTSSSSLRSEFNSYSSIGYRCECDGDARCLIEGEQYKTKKKNGQYIGCCRDSRACPNPGSEPAKD